MQYFKLYNYTIKLRMYPNKAQEELLNTILYEVGKYYNITLYEALHFNPIITKVKEYKDENGEIKVCHWFDKKAANTVKWKNYVLSLEHRQNLEKVNSIALAGNTSIIADVCKALDRKTENNKHIPLEGIEKVRYCSRKEPRKSFVLNGRVCKRDFKFSDNENLLYLNCGTRIGEVKCRGLNKKLRFDEDHSVKIREFFESGGYVAVNKKTGLPSGNPYQLGCKVSKDNCGDWYVSICLPYVYKPMEISEDRKECGIDVGVKEKAIVYDPKNETFEHIKNKLWMYGKDGNIFEPSQLYEDINKLNNSLSGKWGYKNKDFRDARKENPNIKPSNSYLKTDLEYKKINRYIARCREHNNHVHSAYLVNNYNLIALETLSIDEMIKRRHFSDSEDLKLTKAENNKLHNEREFRKVCADTALGQFLALLITKAEWYEAEIVKVDKYFASSQTCSCCGYKNGEVKDTSVRKWTCPICGAEHDRDENAARNIYYEGKKDYKRVIV